MPVGCQNEVNVNSLFDRITGDRIPVPEWEKWVSDYFINLCKQARPNNNNNNNNNITPKSTPNLPNRSSNPRRKS